MFDNLGYGLRVSWPWMLILAAIQFVLAALFPGQWMVVTYPNMGEGTEIDERMFAFVPIYTIIAMVAFASIAVKWHRYLLLGEQSVAAKRLVVNWSVWRYVFNETLLVLGFVAGLPLFGLGLLLLVAFLDTHAEDGAFVPLIFVSCFFLMPIVCAWFARISIKLPAIALERAEYGFRNAWRDSRGSMLSLIGFCLMELIIVGLIAAVSARPLPSEVYELSFHSIVLEIIFALLQLVGNWITMIFYMTSLTIRYRIFAEGWNP